MQKDRLLLEATLATDFRILSLDDRVRGHFSRTCTHIGSLRALLRANPRP